MNTIETINPEPFRHLIMTLGELPTTFTESMSYYEMLAWLCDYLENKVTPAVNNNAEALKELKEYVDNYFDSTDFQEMVNNKLDEMAADGTLGEIIGQYIDENYVTKTDYATDETGGVVKVGNTLEIEDGVLNTKTIEDFISGIDLKYERYQGEGGYTNVYYSIIPAEHKPILRLANGVLNSEDYVAKTSYDNKATLAINAGVYNVTTHNTAGSVVVDGEFLQENYDTFTADRELLFMNNSGRLDVLPYSATEQQIMSVNPVWAVQGFYCTVYNYNATEYGVSNTDFRERTLIGQDIDGNYIVIVTGGRSSTDVGFNPKDGIDFCTHVGFTPRILYHLDGGGSSQIAYHGVTMNQLAGDSGETRKVPNIICFVSNTPKNQGVFDAALTVNNAIIGERRDRVPFNIKPILTANEGVNITNLSVYNQDSYIFIEGQFVTSNSTAGYGKIIEGFPKPNANTYFQVYNSTNKNMYYTYIASSTGQFNNSNLESLPAGTYYIRTFYRINPGKTLSAGLE